MKTIKEIKNILKTHMHDLDEHFKIKQIGIFGSYVRGEQNANSDIDVIVEFKERIGLFGESSMEIYLEKLLKSKVDLIPKEDIRKEIKK